MNKMSTLKEKAQQVLDEKENKIIPENIKNGVEIFDVVGTYTGSGADIYSSNYKINDNSEAEPDAGEIYWYKWLNGSLFLSESYSIYMSTIVKRELSNLNFYCIAFITQDTNEFKLLVINNNYDRQFTLELYGYNGELIDTITVEPSYQDILTFNNQISNVNVIQN